MGLSDRTKGFFLGFAVGFGSGAVFRDYLPELRKGISPLFKFSLKSVIKISEKSREMTARMVEGLQDLTAEVVSELKVARQGASAQGRETRRAAEASLRKPSRKMKKPTRKEFAKKDFERREFEKRTTTAPKQPVRSPEVATSNVSPVGTEAEGNVVPLRSRKVVP